MSRLRADKLARQLSWLMRQVTRASTQCPCQACKAVSLCQLELDESGVKQNKRHAKCSAPCISYRLLTGGVQKQDVERKGCAVSSTLPLLCFTTPRVLDRQGPQAGDPRAIQPATLTPARRWSTEIRWNPYERT